MCRMAHLTQFSIPALLNPMVNKMADASFAMLLLTRYVHMRSGSKLFMIGPRPCAYANVLMLTPFSLVKATT